MPLLFHTDPAPSESTHSRRNLLTHVFPHSVFSALISGLPQGRALAVNNMLFEDNVNGTLSRKEIPFHAHSGSI